MQRQINTIENIVESERQSFILCVLLYPLFIIWSSVKSLIQRNYSFAESYVGMGKA